MRKVLITVLASAALAVPGSAAAGGWATAGLGPPPDGMQAGDTWNAKVTILQHGQTPLSGVQPTVTIRNDKGTTVTFPARPTGEAGVYEAEVRFPSGGAWSYDVYDGFEQYGGGQTHSFGRVTILPGAGDGLPLWPMALFGFGLAAALVVGAALWVTRLRSRENAVPALR
jgi:YtkA-like